MMRRYLRSGFGVVFITVVVASAAHAQQAPIDLLSAVKAGAVWAEFRGAGDAGVTGTVGRYGSGPEQVVIPAGTQFSAQLPGVQGMSATLSMGVDLGQQSIASVYIPAACTNIALAAPTPGDVMLPGPCLDERMARLAAVFDLHPAFQPAVQLATWAVANDPPPWMVQLYLRQVFPGEDLAAAQTRWVLLMTAADLLREAGLEPGQFVMFW